MHKYFANLNLKVVVQRILIAIITVVLASLIRKIFLSSLDNRVAWLTYYPAVMAAALFGGFFTGFLGAILSCIIIKYFWQYISPLPFISDQADYIGLYVFLFNCILVSAIAEYSRWQEKKARKAKKQAELANRAKSIFLANMSHELRTPLNAILGFTQLMKHNINIPYEEQKNIEIVNRSGEHLLNLINNVLDISKIEAGQIKLDVTSFNLKNTLNDVILIMSQRAEALGLFLQTNLENNLPTHILSDELKIKQILINILGNAIKFTKQGNIELTIKTIENNSPENIVLFIEVKDTGLGISANDIHKIFEPFVQVGNYDSSKGTGLGLTICKQFTELLGGKITVESKLGIGSTFTVQIPIKPIDKSEIKLDNYQFIKSLAPNQPLFRILIVEDQQENWLLLQRILENIGLYVRVAENGKDGIDAYNQWKPHLIFMDVRMPVMDGLEATQHIRKTETGKSVKIIGVSAHVFKNEIQNILQNGMDDFIKKPYHFSDIYNSLHKHLGVKYEFHKIIESHQNEHITLKIEMLENLDNTILVELKEHIENLEIDKLKSLTDRISIYDNELSNILRNYIANLKFTEIFRVLNQVSISEPENKKS